MRPATAASAHSSAMPPTAASELAIDAKLIATIEALPYSLMARAEVSHAPDGRHGALSLYALDPATFATMADVIGDLELAERDGRMRRHFSLVPRHWVKFNPLAPGDMSEYYQLAEVSLAALRLFLYAYGAAEAAPRIERAFAPLLDMRDTEWGLVVKRSAGTAQPRISVRLPNGTLGRTLQELVRAEFLSAGHAQRLRDAVRDLSVGPACYLSLDPLRQGGVAVDIPSPDTAQAAAFIGRPLDALQGAISYLKVRYPDGERGEGRFTLYRPAIDALPAEDKSVYLRRVQRYYDEMTPVIEATFGATFQAGQIPTEEAVYRASETTLKLIERTPLRDAPLHLLDLGCGLAGPAIDIAKRYPQVRITGVNLSPVQVERARAQVEAAGLSDRIEVVEGDFHALPFEDGTFDAAYAFEALAYSHQPQVMFGEAQRVLRPGGWLYAKELVREEGSLSANALENLAAHDRTYAMRTRPLSDLRGALEATGWSLERAESVDHLLSTEAYQMRMFQVVERDRPHIFAPQRPRLTPFGQSHFNEHDEMPLFFAEILAVRPSEGAATMPPRRDA